MIAQSCSPSAGFYTIFAKSSGPGWEFGVSPWRAADIPSSPPAEPDDPIEPGSPDGPENPDFPPDDVPPEINDPPPDVLPEPVREPPVMPKPSRRADVGPSGDGGPGTPIASRSVVMGINRQDSAQFVRQVIQNGLRHIVESTRCIT